MITCNYCNINITDDGGRHICRQLINVINQIKPKYAFIHRIRNQFLKSGSSNNVDLYYNSILGYSSQDYKMTNPLLRLDSKSKFSDFLKNNLKNLDIIDSIEAYKDKITADEMINLIIKNEFSDYAGITQTKKIISDLFNFPTFSDQNYLLRGVTLPNYKIYEESFKNFTNGIINKSVIIEKAFTSTSTTIPLDNELLILIFLDPVFSNHQAKNIKSSTKFKKEDEVLFFPESKFVVSHFCNINIFPSSLLFKISPNLGKKFKYIAILIALPLYYNQTNFEKVQFIKTAFNYWSQWFSEKTIRDLALRDKKTSEKRKNIIKSLERLKPVYQ